MYGIQEGHMTPPVYLKNISNQNVIQELTVELVTWETYFTTTKNACPGRWYYEFTHIDGDHYHYLGFRLDHSQRVYLYQMGSSNIFRVIFFDGMTVVGKENYEDLKFKDVVSNHTVGLGFDIYQKTFTIYYLNQIQKLELEYSNSAKKVAPQFGEGFDKTIRTNLKSHYFISKSFLERKMKESNTEGVLLFITSKDGYVCNEIPYGLTKASMNSLIGGLSTAYYRHGIRVNAIAPGVTLTDMTAMYAKKVNGNMHATNYAGRNFLPEEVAEVACFMVSDASKCISGQIIFTDGGDHIKSNADAL